jgi:hypothetical protein
VVEGGCGEHRDELGKAERGMIGIGESFGLSVKYTAKTDTWTVDKRIGIPGKLLFILEKPQSKMWLGDVHWATFRGEGYIQRWEVVPEVCLLTMSGGVGMRDRAGISVFL